MSITEPDYGFPSKTTVFKDEITANAFKFYSTELKETFGITKQMNSPDWTLMWWDLAEKSLDLWIGAMFSRYTEEPSETMKDRVLERILMMSTLEQMMCDELEKLFDGKVVARWRKEMSHDINQKIRKDINDIYNKLTNCTEHCDLNRTD